MTLGLGLDRNECECEGEGLAGAEPLLTQSRAHSSWSFQFSIARINE